MWVTKSNFYANTVDIINMVEFKTENLWFKQEWGVGLWNLRYFSSNKQNYFSLLQFKCFKCRYISKGNSYQNAWCLRKGFQANETELQ